LRQALDKTWWGRRLPLKRLDGVLAGVAMYLLSPRYDVLVTVSHRPLNVLGLLRAWLGSGCTAHLAKEIYLEEADPPQGRRGRKPAKLLSGLLFRTARPPDMLLVNASAERRAYAAALGMPEENVRFVPWPSNIPPGRSPVPGQGYALSAGRSHRDWGTLIRAASASRASFKVVAAARDLEGLDLPGNVEVHADIPHARYLELLEGAEAVVLPLKPVNRSTGQAALLEAMSLGKPVVATNVPGMSDYVTHGREARLVPPGDAAALGREVERILDDEAASKRLGAAAQEKVRCRHTRQIYARRLLDICRELRRAHGPLRRDGKNRVDQPDSGVCER
jgi:glycosyltransferase involved in cell wall biosynthesis